MCLNKKRQTTGSKRVRKEHYIHFCCIRLLFNMLYCLTALFASWFQRTFPVFFLICQSLWEQMTPRTWPIWTTGAWLARFMQGITKHRYIHKILDVGLIVLEFFYSIYSQWAIMTPRVWTILTPGAIWQDLCRGPLNIALYQIYKLWA